MDSDSHQICITVEHNNDPNNLRQSENIISEKAILKALIANWGIAAIKLICWFFSRSSAMLSESIHSGADGFNSLCLLVGLKRGSKPADKFHHFGYGLEANIWAIFASLLMLVGTIVSIYTGWNRLFYNHNHVFELLNNYELITVTLIISILFEVWAVHSASVAVLKEAKVEFKGKLEAFLKSLKHVRQIKSPTTKFVWYEDTAALTGVVIALIAITISKFFVDKSIAYIPDATASLIIGCILLGLAIYLLKHNINVLTVAAARPQVEELIKEIAKKVHGISQVEDLKTMDLGPSGVIISMKIDVDPEIPVKDADNIADKLEEKIKEQIRDVAHVTIEVKANDIEENWNQKFENLIEEGKKTGVLKPREAKIISNFFDFTNTVVWEIMIPRTDVIFVDVDSDIEELIDLIVTSGHTRIPVYEENIDNIIGIINAKDTLKASKDCENKESIKIKDLVREIVIVPENKSLSSMLNEFKIKKTQIAAVVDEHGGVAGIVTVEDILEEIVGEIWDEYDVQVPEIIKIDNNTLSIYSKMNIYDLNERFNLDLPTEDFQTIGGYIFGLLGREPEVDDEVQTDNIKMKIESMEGHKIIRVILFKQDGFVDTQEIEES